MAGRLPRIALALITVLALTSNGARADIVTLKDGRTFEGTVSRAGDFMIIRQADGKEIPVSPSDIQKVTLNSTESPAQVAEGEWARLQVQIKHSDNLAQIIDLHQKFIAKFPGTPSAETAATALAGYQQMDGKDFVKFRGQWVSRAKAEVMLRDGAERARPALELYKASRLKEALAQARDALKVDDENTLANTVAGLAAFRLSDSPTARTYFQKLADVDPSDALAWNNLAVISFQQKREAEALIDYTKALQAAPENRLILDNIAEALHDFSGDQNVKPFKDLKTQADQIETRTAARMADKGLYRYGNTWVTADQRDRLNANSNAVKNAMAQLEAQYNTAVAALAGIDGQIKQAQADYDTAVSNYTYYSMMTYRDLNWSTYSTAAAADMDRASRRKTALEDQRTQLIAAVKGMKAQAAQLTPALAAAEAVRFGGIQRILEIGEVDNPPPPAVIDIPPKAALPTLAPLPAVPQPAAANTPTTPSYSSTPAATVNPANPGVTDTGTLIPMTPIGTISLPGNYTPATPIFPFPTTPTTPTTPINPATKVTPPVTPVAPPRNLPPVTGPTTPVSPPPSAPADPALHPKPAGG